MKAYETYVYHIYYDEDTVRRAYFHTIKEANDYIAKQREPYLWKIVRIIIPRKGKKKGR